MQTVYLCPIYLSGVWICFRTLAVILASDLFFVCFFNPKGSLTSEKLPEGTKRNTDRRYGLFKACFVQEQIEEIKMKSQPGNVRLKYSADFIFSLSYFRQ